MAPQPDSAGVVLSRLHGGDFSSRDAAGRTLLHQAAEEGLSEVCQKLLDNPRFLGPAAIFADGQTALHASASHGHAAACEVLLAHPRFSRQVSARTRGGDTALHCAAHHGHAEAVHALVSAVPSEARAQDFNGRTALHVAAEQGHHGACAALLGNPSFPATNTKDWRGLSALHLAAKCGHAQVCNLLLSHQRFVEAGARDRDGMTALHYAALRGHAGACEVLVKHPRFVAYVHSVDNSGRTVASFARGDVMRLFLHSAGVAGQAAPAARGARQPVQSQAARTPHLAGAAPALRPGGPLPEAGGRKAVPSAGTDAAHVPTAQPRFAASVSGKAHLQELADLAAVLEALASQKPRPSVPLDTTERQALPTTSAFGLPPTVLPTDGLEGQTASRSLEVGSAGGGPEAASIASAEWWPPLAPLVDGLRTSSLAAGNPGCGPEELPTASAERWPHWMPPTDGPEQETAARASLAGHALGRGQVPASAAAAVGVPSWRPTQALPARNWCTAGSLGSGPEALPSASAERWPHGMPPTGSREQATAARSSSSARPCSSSLEPAPDVALVAAGWHDRGSLVNGGDVQPSGLQSSFVGTAEAQEDIGQHGSIQASAAVEGKEGKQQSNVQVELHVHLPQPAVLPFWAQPPPNRWHSVPEDEQPGRTTGREEAQSKGVQCSSLPEKAAVQSKGVQCSSLLEKAAGQSKGVQCGEEEETPHIVHSPGASEAAVEEHLKEGSSRERMSQARRSLLNRRSVLERRRKRRSVVEELSASEERPTGHHAQPFSDEVKQGVEEAATSAMEETTDERNATAPEAAEEKVVANTGQYVPRLSVEEGTKATELGDTSRGSIEQENLASSREPFAEEEETTWKVEEEPEVAVRDTISEEAGASLPAGSAPNSEDEISAHEDANTAEKQEAAQNTTPEEVGEWGIEDGNKYAEEDAASAAPGEAQSDPVQLPVEAEPSGNMDIGQRKSEAGLSSRSNEDQKPQQRWSAQRQALMNRMRAKKAAKRMQDTVHDVVQKGESEKIENEEAAKDRVVEQPEEKSSPEMQGTEMVGEAKGMTDGDPMKHSPVNSEADGNGEEDVETRGAQDLGLHAEGPAETVTAESLAGTGQLGGADQVQAASEQQTGEADAGEAGTDEDSTRSRREDGAVEKGPTEQRTGDDELTEGSAEEPLHEADNSFAEPDVYVAAESGPISAAEPAASEDMQNFVGGGSATIPTSSRSSTQVGEPDHGAAKSLSDAVTMTDEATPARADDLEEVADVAEAKPPVADDGIATDASQTHADPPMQAEDPSVKTDIGVTAEEPFAELGVDVAEEPMDGARETASATSTGELPGDAGLASPMSSRDDAQQTGEADAVSPCIEEDSAQGRAEDGAVESGRAEQRSEDDDKDGSPELLVHTADKGDNTDAMTDEVVVAEPRPVGMAEPTAADEQNSADSGAVKVLTSADAEPIGHTADGGESEHSGSGRSAAESLLGDPIADADAETRADPPVQAEDPSVTADVEAASEEPIAELSVDVTEEPMAFTTEVPESAEASEDRTSSTEAERVQNAPAQAESGEESRNSERKVAEQVQEESDGREEAAKDVKEENPDTLPNAVLPGAAVEGQLKEDSPRDQMSEARRSLLNRRRSVLERRRTMRSGGEAEIVSQERPTEQEDEKRRVTEVPGAEALSEEGGQRVEEAVPASTQEGTEEGNVTPDVAAGERAVAETGQSVSRLSDTRRSSAAQEKGAANESQFADEEEEPKRTLEEEQEEDVASMAPEETRPGPAQLPVEAYDLDAEDGVSEAAPSPPQGDGAAWPEADKGNAGPDQGPADLQGAGDEAARSRVSEAAPGRRRRRPSLSGRGAALRGYALLPRFRRRGNETKKNTDRPEDPAAAEGQGGEARGSAAEAGGQAEEGPPGAKEAPGAEDGQEEDRAQKEVTKAVPKKRVGGPQRRQVMVGVGGVNVRMG